MPVETRTQTLAKLGQRTRLQHPSRLRTTQTEKMRVYSRSKLPPRNQLRNPQPAVVFLRLAVKGGTTPRKAASHCCQSPDASTKSPSKTARFCRAPCQHFDGLQRGSFKALINHISYSYQRKIFFRIPYLELERKSGN